MFKVTDAKNPEEYIAMIDEPRKSEIQKLHDLILKTVPDLKPFMISGMIGYGKFHYKGKSTEGEWCIIALASQKNYISVYACASDGKNYVAEKYAEVLSTKDTTKKRPKVSIGKSCIRFKNTEDIDFEVLKKVLKESESLGGFMTA